MLKIISSSMPTKLQTIQAGRSGAVALVSVVVPEWELPAIESVRWWLAMAAVDSREVAAKATVAWLVAESICSSRRGAWSVKPEGPVIESATSDMRTPMSDASSSVAEMVCIEPDVMTAEVSASAVITVDSA